MRSRHSPPGPSVRNRSLGLILLGSRARTERPADEWSDTDLLVITTDAERWTGSGAWLGDLGEVVVTFTEPTALGGLLERRVMFVGGTDLNLVPVPVQRMEELVSPAGALPVLARVHRVLVDKQDLFTRLGDRELPRRIRGRPRGGRGRGRRLSVRGQRVDAPGPPAPPRTMTQPLFSTRVMSHGAQALQPATSATATERFPRRRSSQRPASRSERFGTAARSPTRSLFT